MELDFSFLTTFFEQFFGFLQYVWDWFTVGIYQFFTDLMAYFTKIAMLVWLQSTIVAVQVATKVVQSIVNDLGVLDSLQSIYNSMPSDVRSIAAFFRIPEAIGMVLSAYPVRFTMRFIPFIGR